MAKELSDEEYAALEAKATRDDAVEKEKADLLKEKAELEKEVNPNWKQFREREKNLIKNLKNAGVKVNEDTGELEGDTKISIEDVEARATAVARREAVNIRKEELLGQIDNDDDRGVVEKLFGKLTVGEEVNMKNISGYFRTAVNASGIDAGGNKIMDIISGSAGRPPKRVEKKEEILDDATAGGLAGAMGIKIEEKK